MNFVLIVLVSQVILGPFKLKHTTSANVLEDDNHKKKIENRETHHDDANNEESKSAPTITDYYDFIIVGGGSTGSVIANRLSEIQNWKVLLLEAGEEPTILTDIPSFAPMFQFTNYNWGYLTERQENFSLGLTDGRMHWPRGRALGGSSVINYMIHVRGNKDDYNNWEALGNTGWSYNDLLPLFLKSEASLLRDVDQEYHNTDGLLSVEDVSYITEAGRAFITAAQETGYTYTDYNGANQLGVSYLQATTRRGSRCSAAKAFVQTARSRPNLTIVTKARVIKLLIDTKTKEAYGVEFVQNKKRHRIGTMKEVILSAGVFNSPQLLILSGIGPANHLQELKIPVIQHLPVGQKIYDHLSFPGLTFTVNQSIVLQQRLLEEPQNILQYLYDGTGPLTTLGGTEAVVFLKSNVTNIKGNAPDMELLFISGGLHTDRGTIYRKMMRITDEIYNEVWKPLENLYAFSIWPILLQPKSHGYLQLKSRNPFHHPVLHANYFTDPKHDDIKTFIVGIREAQRIVAAPAFKKYDARQITTAIPGCTNYMYDSDDYWECAVRHISATMYHQTSTCKMGPNVSEAVVDSRLRVYDIKNLRVADTSVFPTTVSAHTGVPAYVVGEKASDIIKEDWSVKT